MKRLLLVLAILVATTGVSRASDFWRDSGQACFFGATVLGISAAMVLYPAVADGVTTLPATTLVVGNAIFGCGLGLLGSTAAWGFGALYDRLVPSDPPYRSDPPLRKPGSET